LPDRKPFAFAGLWETWNKKSDSESIYKSCTIITTQASESFSEIHHRMPVILKSKIYEPWLDPRNPRESAYDEFMQKMQAAMEECSPRPECREAIEEDMEIVGVYLRTNGRRPQGGIVIFSCAAELFWRALERLRRRPLRC